MPNTATKQTMKKIFKSLYAIITLIAFISICFLITSCRSSKLPGAIYVIEHDHDIELSNDLVKAIFTTDSNNVKQKYFAKNKNEWKLVAESLNEIPDTGSDIIPLYKKGSDVAEKYRLLANEGLTTAKVIEKGNGSIKLQLNGILNENEIEQTVELKEGQDFFHIEVNSTLIKEPRLEYLLSSFTFSITGHPDYTFVPTVKRADDDVVGDRKFFAPAAIIEKDGYMLSLVPDLNLINEQIVYAKGARPQKHPRIFAVPFDTTKTTLPAALDLNLNSGISDQPLLAYGLVDYWTEQHLYWRHDNNHGSMVRDLSANKLKYGFDLFLNSAVTKNRGYQRIASYLWKKYGHEYFLKPKPQAMPFSEYAEVCYPASFAYQGYDVISPVKESVWRKRPVGDQSPTIGNRSGHPELATWQQWEEKGIKMGGLRLSAPQWYQFIYNTPWWNNVCDATGIYYWGKRNKDSSLLDKARRIINFTISTPQQNGIFPSLYDINKKMWIGSLWNLPGNGYNPDSTANYWNWQQGNYQPAAASVTAGYLMQYLRTCEYNPGILPFVKHYGDFLIQHMQDNGCVPSWFTADLIALPSMKWNADGGAHIWVLSELYRTTNEKKYLEAAMRMAKFMTEEVLPAQKWYDFETFYSCAVKKETFYDKRTGQYPANNMSVTWALEGFASLYDVTQDMSYLSTAQAIADYSIFYQAVWAPHYIITAYPFGGFSSQNSDAEWLDQRSHRFANGLVRIGLLAGRQDLLERGVAATRASLTLINHPRHIENDIYKFPNYPLGLGPENIDHEGFPQMPLRSGPSWCEVGGLAATAHVMDKLGGVYYDVRKNIALGIDGVSVVKHSLNGDSIHIQLHSLLSELKIPFNQPFMVDLHMVGLENKDYKLLLNDNPEVVLKSKALENLKLTVHPDNRITLQQ